VNAILAQAAALAAHAKSRAADPALGGDAAYWASHSTFKYVKSVSFVDRKRRFLRTVEQEVASAVPEWMARLPIGARIELVCGGSTTIFPARISSALAGGTREGIFVSSGTASGVWLSDWQLSGDRYPEPGVWRVRYANTHSSRARALATIDEASARLRAVLAELERFARSDSHLSGWTDTFAGAAAMFDAPEPVAPYHPDILPPDGYTLAARRLLAAAVSAYVFGGMGSWNDVAPSTPEGQSAYRRLSEQLYEAVIGGIVTAVNT
jgi:hypothetical protein